MLASVKHRWFLLSLVTLIVSGLTLGSRVTSPPASSLLDVYPALSTGLVLFLMSFSLDSRQLASSLKSPGPVIWSSLINYGFIPLICWPLMAIQQTEDFKVGLMIAAGVPCTMAAAAVWTRKAHGNDAVALLVTVLTNGTCFMLTPFWLNLTTGHDVDLDVGRMVQRLMLSALVPMVLGQVLRQFSRPAAFATTHKAALGVLAQACILTLVFLAAWNAGGRLDGNGPTPSLGAVMRVWSTCIAVHLTAMGVAVLGAIGWGFSRPDQVAVSFASSQKTLPIGLLVATSPAMFGEAGVPFAVFPMLMYHASQLFIDTAVADRWAARTTPQSPAVASAE